MPPEADPAKLAATPAPDTARTDEVVPDFIDLPRGKELNEAQAIDFAGSRPVQLVVIAGPVKGGKTTLLTSLYEMFQAAPVSGQNFAGSITLPGLEDRCHRARTASENDVSKTGRTLYKGPEPQYLHLRTAAVLPPKEPTDFLFTDVSGEVFEHAVNSETECRELTYLKRANHFLLLLDGEKGVRPEKWAMVQNARTLLQSCLDNEMLAKFCTVNVIWSKSDYFESASRGDKAEHKKFRDDTEREFRERFGGRIADLKFSEIAARPKQAPELGPGKGVAELLRDWIGHSPRYKPMNLQPTGPAGTRESELFAQRPLSPSAP
jgi:hypothetical protein